MTSDEAHRLCCRAFASDDRIHQLNEAHGDALYLSLLPPCESTNGKWVELLLLGLGDAQFIDDPAGESYIVAKCTVDPVTHECKVSLEPPTNNPMNPSGGSGVS